MSYTQDIKKEICGAIPHKLCCKKAMMNGLLLSCGEVEEHTITLSLNDTIAADFAVKMIREIYKQESDIRRSSKGGRGVMVSFFSKSASHYVKNALHNTDFQPETDFHCDQCSAYFMQGIFLGVGSVTDPVKQYRLEFTVKNGGKHIQRFLSEHHVPPLSSVRRGKHVLYYRANEMIADWFGFARLLNVYYDMQNAFFTHALNNETNRQNNCVIRNISRTVNSVQYQIALIRELQERQLLSLLPEELRETAELRLRFDDYSLSQLALASNPPLTKSGLNHRLKKIVAFAEEKLK